MRIIILTIGSRGDIQPFIALGKALQGRGHAVRLVTGGMYEGFVRGHGLDFAAINDEAIRIGETPEGRAAIEAGGGKMALLKKVLPMLRRMMDDAWAGANDAEAIIYHPKALAGYHIAEKLRIPSFMSLPLPLYTPTSAFPTPIMNIRLGGAVNRLTYTLLRFATAPYAGTVNAWRKDALHLPPRGKFANDLVLPDGQPVPTLYSYSPHVVPTPPDWPETAVTTGYWFLDDTPGWTPPAALQAFLDAGAPPVYVGFGSMTGVDPEGKARMVVEALRQAGQRGLIASGWGGLRAGDLPESIFMIESAPHEWLFPRCAAVVHHGGAGTTAAGLRAGRPTVVVPFFGDQGFWGERVCQLGVGPQPIPQKRLTANGLAAAIRAAVNTPDMARRAGELGDQIRAEDGVGTALRFIEARLGVPAQAAV
jgi:sterol 3beta-glucosyltransferase